jgi:hypothetical protein
MIEISEEEIEALNDWNEKVKEFGSFVQLPIQRYKDWLNEVNEKWRDKND